MSKIKVKYFEVDSEAVVIKIEYFDIYILDLLSKNPSLRSMKLDDWHIQLYLSPIQTRVTDCQKISDDNKRIELTLQFDANRSGYLINNYFTVRKHRQTYEEVIIFYNKIFENLSKLSKL